MKNYFNRAKFMKTFLKKAYLNYILIIVSPITQSILFQCKFCFTSEVSKYLYNTINGKTLLKILVAKKSPYIKEKEESLSKSNATKQESQNLVLIPATPCES